MAKAKLEGENCLDINTNILGKLVEIRSIASWKSVIG